MMTFQKKTWLLCMTVSLLLIVSTAYAKYPTKPITLIVPFGIGGDSDASARLWAKFAEKELGQPVHVVNKTGAGGLTGTLFAANAKPDGYTLFLGQAGPCIVMPILYGDKGLHFESFEYITRFMRANNAVVAAASAPWDSLKEFQADTQKYIRTYVFSSPSKVSWLTLAFSNWALQNTVHVRHVNYSSAAEAAASIVGKYGDITFLFPNNYTQLVDEQKLKILAIADKSERYPQALTFDEQGYKGDFFGWSGIVAPKGTPAKVVNTLIYVTEAMAKNAHFLAEIKAFGFTPDSLSGDAWANEVKAQYSDIKKLLKELNSAETLMHQ